MAKPTIARWALAAALVSFLATPSNADIPCPNASYCTVSFSKTYSGAYRPGQPYDYVTISPNGAGETFSGTGIAIRVYLKNCNGAPIVGVPAQEIVLFNSNLCICPGGNIADHATDINGMTTFTGTIRGGGCGDPLAVFADGILIGVLPVKVNSPDRIPASPCAVDASDLAHLAAALGSEVGEAHYTICLDWNEDGYVDASDLAWFAALLGAECL